ncbi:hypothetical protein O0L34_g15366 [Tuta absoluta]|nr:hypothetical protein O0L34_g15366 [Tuta absoluta]
MSDKQSGSSGAAHKILWQMNAPIDVDAYDDEISKDTLLAENKNVRKPSSIKHPKEIRQLCNLFQLNLQLPLQELKRQLKQNSKLSNVNLNLNSPKAKECTSIYISLMPAWFKSFHVKSLIQLKSDFDVDSNNYFIDMIKDDQDILTGECLLRFVKNEDCLQVYEDLQGMVVNDVPLPVMLDLDHNIAKGRKLECPKFEEQLRKYTEIQGRFKQELELDAQDKARVTNNVVIKKEVEDETNNDLYRIGNVDNNLLIGRENEGSDTHGYPSLLVKKEYKETDGNQENNEETLKTMKNEYSAIKAEPEDNVEINQPSSLIPEEVIFKTDILEDAMEYEEYENLTDVNQEPLDEPINTPVENVIQDQNNKSSAVQKPTTNSTNEPNDQHRQNKNKATQAAVQNESCHSSGAPRDEYYYYYNKCTIIHIKNIPAEPTYKVLFIIKNLLAKKTVTEMKYKFVKVTNKDEQKTDFLLQFKTHDHAVRACNILNKTEILGSKIEVIMGLGYTFEEGIISEQLDLFERRREMIEDWDQKHGHTPKESKIENSVTPDKTKTTREENTSTHQSSQQTSIENSSSHLTYNNAKEDISSTHQPSKKARVEKSSTHQTHTKVLVEDSSIPGATYLPPEELSNEHFGLSRQVLYGLGITLPLSRRIKVSNLHSKVDEAKLLEVFSIAGEVKKTQISIDVANIEYDHPLEAVQAISMFHKRLLYNKPMVVKMDRSQTVQSLPVGLSSIGQGLGHNGAALRGARVEAELQNINKMFFEMGRMKKFGQAFLDPPKFGNGKKARKKYKNLTAFEYIYKKADVPVNVEALKKGGAGYQQTRDHPMSRGISPPEISCQNLHSIMASYQETNNPNQRNKHQSSQNTSMNIVSTSLNIQNRNSGPKGLNPATNIAPQANPLDEAINRVMQFMTPNTLSTLQPALPQIPQRLPNPGVLGNSNSIATLLQNPIVPQPDIPKAHVDSKIDKNSERESRQRKDRKEKIRLSPNRDERDAKRSRDRDYIYSTDRLDRDLKQSRSKEGQDGRSRDRDYIYSTDRVDRDFKRSRNSDSDRSRDRDYIYSTDRDLKRRKRYERSRSREHYRQSRDRENSFGRSRSRSRDRDGNYLRYDRESSERDYRRRDSIDIVYRDIDEEFSRQIRDSLVKEPSQSKMSNILVFSDLPRCLSSASLARKMRDEVGEVGACEMTAPGRALLRFVRADHAETAIRLFHRAKVDGQAINVGYI